MRAAKYILAFAALLMFPAAANPVVVKPHPWTSAYYNLGLFAARNTRLRIASEDLSISPDQVRIRYQLANDTGVARSEHLVFPLPEIEVGNYWFDPAKEGPLQRAMLGRHTADPLNFIGFRVLVNGKPVAVQGHQIAVVWRATEPGGELQNTEVTDEIKQAGLPVMIFGKSDVLERLPEATRRKLFDARLLGTHDEDWRPGRYPKTYYPAWKVVTEFGWEQPFPAKGVVAVDVTYQPMTGGSVRVVPGDQLGWETWKACYQDLVLPDWTPWGISSRKAVRYRTTGYILTTANYWNGPIGRFHLTVDKLNPKGVLSLCWDGSLTKTGPTTYEFSADRFTPKNDIVMVVFE